MKRGEKHLIEIDKLTEKTILHDEIFQEIFDQEDEFEKAKLVIALTEKADELRVKKKFDTLLKAFKKSTEKKQKESKQLPEYPSFNRMTEFNSSKYDEMYCGGWICDSDGVRIIDNNGVELTICHHPIFPVQRLISIETGKEKVKLAYKDLNRWKEIIIDKRTIADVNKIISLVDFSVDVNSNNAKALMKYLTDILNYNIDTIDTQTSTGKLGWVDDGFIPYCKTLVFDGEQKFKDVYESINEVGSETKWMELVKSVRESDRFEPKITMIASLASVLIEPLNALPFIMNLYETTGKGKTVSCMLATSIWANPAENVYMTDAKSTATALELRLDVLNSLPMFIDDMSQVKKKYDGDFTDLVYMLCSGKGKDRANTTLGLNKSTNWKNIIITNYEHSLVTETMQGGAVNRIIDVPCADGYIFENGNAVVETISHNYGFAGRKFIDVIEQVGIDKIKEIQKKAYAAIVKKAKEKGCEKEEKQILPMSILLTADYLATDYIFEDKQYLDFEFCVDLLKNKGDVNENERGYNFILNEVMINRSKFVPDERGQYRGDIWGLIENGYVIIYKNIFDNIIKKTGCSSKTFLSWADKNELLQKQRGNQKQKRINGDSPKWCIFLKMSDDIEGDENVHDLPTNADGFVDLEQYDQSEMPFN
jgi:hypothetical protein